MGLSMERQPDGTYLATYRFYTFFAFYHHILGAIRQYIKEEKGFIKELLEGTNHRFYPLRGLVTFGSSSNNGSITPAGTNRMLAAGIFNINNDIGAVSFGGTACNQIDTSTFTALRKAYTYMLKAPATSANSLANVGAANYNVYYYTDVAQNDTAGTVDAHGVSTGTSTAASGSLTPVANNCVVFGALFFNEQTGTRSGASNLNNLLQQSGGIASSASVDTGNSNNVATPSSQTQSENSTVSDAWAVLQISMVTATQPASGGRPIPFFSLLGVGT